MIEHTNEDQPIPVLFFRNAISFFPLTTLGLMSLSLPSTLTITTFFIIVFTTHLTTLYSQNVTFPNCTNTFSCGSLRNVTYPFTGGDRPHHCGPPEFRLTCHHNYTELTTAEFTYRVLHINQTQQTLTLARLDLWNNTCPSQLVNSTLNSTIFTYAADNQDLTLIYGCNSSAMTFRPQNLFTCNVSGFGFSDAYYLLGPIPTDPILRIIECSVTVTTQVTGAVEDWLNTRRTSLDEALMEGFSVNYSDPYGTNCSRCVSAGWQCGFDSVAGQPVCICRDNLCFLSGGRSSSGIVSIVVSVVGAVLGGVIIGWLIFFCRQRRKRLAAKSSQTQSSELLTAPTSKGLTSTYSAKFTERIPSYPSSNSDIGKGSTYFGVQVFSYNELEEATNNFDASRELGDGGFGTVYYGKLLDGREIAVKRLYENNFRRVEQFMNEVEILTRLHHQHLVKLYGCTSKRSRELLLVYEYIPNGTVADHLHGKQAKSGSLPWPIRLKIAIETAEALAYLHRSDIIHRDVKTTNILLDNSFCVKVADFGLSRFFPNDATHVSTAPQGTPGYVDPEYYQCYQLTDKSDVFSFGVVLIELISSLQAVDTNRHRHDINLANMAVNKIQNHGLNELIDPSLGCEMDSSVRRMTTMVGELAFRCLQQEKDMRPTMKEVLNILRGIENKESHVQKAEVVEIVVDEGDMVPLKDNPPPPGPLSPDSVIVNEWVSSSTLDSEN